MVSLCEIHSSTEFKSKVRDEASELLNKFMQFETITTAMNFLQIFKISTPLSDYLYLNIFAQNSSQNGQNFSRNLGRITQTVQAEEYEGSF